MVQRLRSDSAMCFGTNSTEDDVPILRMEMEPNVVRRQQGLRHGDAEMDAQHADDWREVTAKLQEAASAGDTADAVQALEVVLDEGDAFESDVVKDAAMVTAALQQAADAELFVVDRQGDVVTQLICSRCAHGMWCTAGAAS